MSWGFGAWGLDFYGTDPNLLLEGAVAVNTHAVMVTCSRPLRMMSAIADGDALNPGTWIASYATDSVAMTPISVEGVGDRQVIITFREPLRSWNNYHLIGSTTLQADNLVLISAPYSVMYRGVLPTTAINEPRGPFDLFTTDIVGGSLKTNENGGYVRVYGVDLIRKMIFRRLTTMPGAYFYMSEEEFGVGLKIKGILRSSNLLQLQREITDEILREPGTVAAKVALTLGSGVLSIHAKVQTDQGEVETTVTATS
jgi:hypothetical protein